MKVKVQVVETGVDRSEGVPTPMSCVSHRTDCTLPRKLKERELRNRPSAAIQALYRLELRLPGEVTLMVQQQNDV
jgi:hypothetical protein